MPSISPVMDENDFLAGIIIHQAHFSLRQEDNSSPGPLDKDNGQILGSCI